MKPLLMFASLFFFHSAMAVPPVPPATDLSAQPGAPGKVMDADTTTDKTLLAGHAVEVCRADVEKFCKGVHPGGGSVIACLKEHEESLSPGCKAQGDIMKAKFKEKREAIREACKDDFMKFCKGTQGPKNRLDCLESHSSELNAQCKSALPEFKK